MKKKLMVKINSINPKDILKLFPGWKYKDLPYCTAGRPSYGSDKEKKYEEKISVPFIWYGISSFVTFERRIGGSTNFHWGMRDFGTVTKVRIGDVIIDTTKENRSESYQYGTKFVGYRYSTVEAPMKRVLKALRDKKIPRSVIQSDSDHLVYLPKDELWLMLQHVADYNYDGFFYVGKHTPQESYSTYYYTVHESNFEK
jgi:hypothetical protein